MLNSEPKPIKACAVPTERRRASRYRVHWVVTVRGVDDQGRLFDEAGYLENLSSTGALIKLPRIPGPSARLSIRITIPFKKREYINYSARVARAGEAGREGTVAIVFETQRPSFTSA